MILTTPQAAARLGVTVRRVEKFITDGRLPARKVGRDWLIDEKDLSTFAAKERRNGRPPLHNTQEKKP